MRVTVLLSSRVAAALEIVSAWAQAGDAVTVVLLDAAAAVARPGHAEGEALRAAVAAKVVVLAHDDAIRRRMIGTEALADGVKLTELDEIADLVAMAHKAVWW